MDLQQTQNQLVGTWVSIAPEIRPSASKNADGTLKPFFLTREFTFQHGDLFKLTIVNSADSNGKVPLARIYIKGHVQWQGAHPIADGAQKVNFVADVEYTVTPLDPGIRRYPQSSREQGLRPVGCGRDPKRVRQVIRPIRLGGRHKLYGIRSDLLQSRATFLGRTSH